MIIYNNTVHVEPVIEMKWVQWAKTIHIPQVMDTGYFKNFRFLKLLNESPESTGVTYAIQFETDSLSTLQLYLSKEAPIFQENQIKVFGQQCLGFQTVLEEVD